MGNMDTFARLPPRTMSLFFTSPHALPIMKCHGDNAVNVSRSQSLIFVVDKFFGVVRLLVRGIGGMRVQCLALSCKGFYSSNALYHGPHLLCHHPLSSPSHIV